MYVEKCLVNAFNEANEVIDEVLGSKFYLSGNVITKITTNSRLTSVYGRCITNRKQEQSRIEISTRLLNDEVSHDDLVQTMIHELLHSLHDCQCHTGQWKIYADEITRNTKYKITRLSKIEGATKERDYKYMFVCEDCCQVIKRTRKSKFTEHPENYCCGKCHGKFKRIR